MSNPLRVLVTGASSGIGAAVAASFAADGAIVTGCARHQRLGSDGANARGGRVTSVVGDVRDVDTARRAVAVAAPEGRLDVLVLSAGVHDGGIGLDGNLDELADTVDMVLEINVKGYILPLAAAASALRLAHGVVVMVLSDATYLAGGNGAGIAYTAAKHADLGVLRWAARALAPDVRVNGVAPGGVRTGLKVVGGAAGEHALWDDPDAAADRQARIRSGNPLGIILEPAEIAQYIRFLAAPQAGALTGEVIRLDGGRSLAAGWHQ